MAKDTGLDSVVRDMLKDFKLSADADADNRNRALFIQDFIRPGADQWSKDQVASRGSRATYSFNQLPKFGRQVINDMWMNVPQIKYIPKGDTNKDKAELLEDKVREVQASGAAQTAYKLAIASQINIGWGYFAFNTEYDNDKDFDQNIVIRQIPNPLQIYDDPSTREQDRSDRRWLIEVEDVPRTDFNKNNDRDYTAGDLVSIGDSYPSWASMGKDLVRIGHYWRLEYDKSKLWQNKETGETTTEKPKDKDNYNEREIKKPRVMYYKCTATEKLEEREWEGCHIPFCFVEGNKNIVDGKVYYTGLYEDMVSTQILYNYATNTAIELAESAPISPFIGDHRAFKGFEKFYDQANTKNYAYLPFNGVDDTDQPIPAPTRMQNGADLSSAVALIQMAEQNFYGTSGIYPASLGQQSNEKSGKAIIARQREGDVSTSNYPDSFARALLYGGIIFKDLARKIYDGKRTLQTMGEDKKLKAVKINQRYKDEATGKPQYFDLTEGDYDVQVSTGASYTTKREEAREAQIELFQAAPQAMLPALPMIIRNMDWPGADKTADAVERGLPPELRDPERMQEQMKDIPPVVAQQLMQSQQIIEQLGLQLQEAQAIANDKQAENQAKLADVQIKAQQAQTQAQKDAAEAEYKMLDLQFRKEEAEREDMLEIEKIKLEWAKLQVSNVETGKPVQEMPQEQMLPANLGANALQGHLVDIHEKQAQEQMQFEVQVQQTAEQNELKLAEIQQQEQSTVALMTMLESIAQSVNTLSMTINTPKTAVKDANGQWVVAPVTTMVN